MATLSGKNSKGKDNWDVYVKYNPNYSTIDYEIERGITAVEFYKSPTDIPSTGRPTKSSPGKVSGYLSAGDKIKIINIGYVTRGNIKFANIKYKNTNGYVTVSSIRKPTGKGGADAEQRTLDATVGTIQKLEEIAGIGRGNRIGIDIEVPGVGMFIGITNLEKVQNRIHGREAKSDFAFKNALGKKVLFISHKDGSGPSAFGQYGGVSEASSGNLQNASKIYQNSEIQNYLSKLYRLYDNAVNGGRSVPNNPFNEKGVLTKGLYRLVQGSQLVNQSVYGPDYGGSYGPDNVHLIGQGQFVFTPLLSEEDDLYFRLSFTGPMEINGDTSVFLNDNSGYRATIITTFRSGRPTGTPLGVVPQTRTGIYPRSYRQSAVSIDTFNI